VFHTNDCWLPWVLVNTYNSDQAKVSTAGTNEQEVQQGQVVPY